MTRAALIKHNAEDLFDESSLKKIETLTAKPAMKKDYDQKTNRLRIPNKIILQILLDISIDKNLNESDQIKLLECLNTLNEY